MAARAVVNNHTSDYSQERSQGAYQNVHSNSDSCANKPYTLTDAEYKRLMSQANRHDNLKALKYAFLAGGIGGAAGIAFNYFTEKHLSANERTAGTIIIALGLMLLIYHLLETKDKNQSNKLYQQYKDSEPDSK